MKFLKVGGVIFGAFLITTLGISAADTLSGTNDSLLGQLIPSTDSAGCPQGMTSVPIGQTFSCVDTYEASPSKDCPILRPARAGDTQSNINEISCSADSVKELFPWTYVTREQAQVLCMRAGKRLPSAQEWYVIAVGTPDTAVACNTERKGPSSSGALDTCRSAAGAYDTIGNVWEWTSDDVIDGFYNGRVLPQEGYVTQVASDGVATVTQTAPASEFADDYLWSLDTGAYGILRGGYFGSKEDAGVFSVQAKTLPTAATVAIGFRCVL